MPLYCELRIAYRLQEVLDQTRTGPHIGFSLLSSLIKLTLIILLFVEVSVTFVICSTSMPTPDRNPMFHHLSANKVRAADIVQVAHMEKGDVPHTQ